MCYNSVMSVKDELLNKLLEGRPISGAELSRNLGVSRNAVWKAVKELTAAGYEITAQTDGYKLIGGNVISEAAIRRFVATAHEIDIRYETPSTNIIAKTAADEGKDVIVVSDGQTAGRGRFRRSFFSPHGAGVYFSVTMRPALDMQKAQLITAYTAVAVAETVERMTGGEVKIKWVNDLYMNGKKICGILTEAAVGMEGNSLDYAVAGIGVNVYKTDMPDDIANTATSIEAETGRKIDRNELIAGVVSALGNIESEIKNGSFMNKYRTMSNIIGREVLVNNEHCALVKGIDDDGSILLETETGLYKMNGGEVSIKVK